MQNQTVVKCESCDPPVSRFSWAMLVHPNAQRCSNSAGMLLITLCLLIIELAWLRPRSVGL